MANSVDPDQIPHSMTSDLGLHCLLRLVWPSIKDFYGMSSPDRVAILLLSMLGKIFNK